MAALQGQVWKLWRSCLCSRDLRDPVEDLQVMAESWALNIRIPKGLKGKVGGLHQGAEELLEARKWCPMQTWRQKQLRRKRRAPSFFFALFFHQAASLLAATTHIQDGPAPFSKSGQPHPELPWSNLVAHFLLKWVQSASYCIQSKWLKQKLLRTIIFLIAWTVFIPSHRHHLRGVLQGTLPCQDCVWKH